MDSQEHGIQEDAACQFIPAIIDDSILGCNVGDEGGDDDTAYTVAWITY